MNDHTDDFERKARARLQAELGRVSVPQGRPRRARPQAAVGWGKRLVGATALAALAALVLLVVAARIYVPEQTAGPAQPAERGERLYLLSTVGVEVDGAMATSGGRIRAFDPATQQDVWAVARPAFKIPVDSSLSETDETPLAPFPLPGFDETRALSSTQSEYRIKISPYWIDGAVSPDGATLYVADPFTISALDAATGQVRWQQMADSDSSNVEYIAGGWPVLAGSADSTILYVQRLWSRGGKTDRWIDLLDARSGEQRGRIDLPANIQAGQMIAAPDATTLYYITHEQVLKIRNNQVDPKIYTIGTGIRDAALTPDGRTLYLLNGASELLRYDTATATLKLTSITLGILDIRSGLGGTLLLSPSADKLVVQVFDESYTEPKLYVADPTTGKRLATLPDPEVTEGRWLQGPTLAFDTSGTALYGVANFGAPNPTAWDDRLVRVNLADGSATSLLDLEIENVARLLVSQKPAPAEAATPPEAPQATATPISAIPTPAPTLTPVPERGTIAWLLNAQRLSAWDSSGQPITLEVDAEQPVYGTIERLSEPPLLIVELADGKAGILEPYTGKLTTLDVPIADMELPIILSSTGATVAFKTHTQGQDDAQIRLADLDSGAVWTLLDQATNPDFMLADATLLSWDDQIIIETHSSATYTLWRSDFRPNDPGAPPPQLKAVKTLGNGGSMQLNSSVGVLAYAETGGDGLHLLNLGTDQDRLIAPDVFRFALDTVVGNLAYLRQSPASPDRSELVLYSWMTGVETVLAEELNPISAELKFVRQGGYLVLRVGGSKEAALVFAIGSNPRLVAEIALDAGVSAVDVNREGEIITLGGADGEQQLKLYPLNNLSSPTVIPIGSLLDEADPATLVFVP